MYTEKPAINTSLKNVEEAHKEDSSKPVINELIEGTKFRINGTKEIGYRVTLANVFVSKPYETKEEAIEAVENKDWEIITGTITAIIWMDKKEEEKAE